MSNRNPRRPSSLAVLAIALSCAFLLSQTPNAIAKPSLDDFEVGSYEIGGEFSLTNQDGKPTTLKDLQGKVLLVFFGYTFCPDICPTTMADITRLLRSLGPQAKQLLPVFVTLDPERDTPARLRSYLENFEKGFIGLTGTESQISQVAKQYKVRYAKRAVNTSAKYLIDHTALLYMISPQGKVKYLFPPDAGLDLMTQGIKKLQTKP